MPFIHNKLNISNQMTCTSKSETGLHNHGINNLVENNFLYCN